MKIGIYNRWLATLGGGEKHSLGVAEVLSREHDVTVISHVSIPRDVFAERLNVSVPRVKFVVVPDRPAELLDDISADYDLFINASHLDFVPNHAPRAAALVWFPKQVDLDAPAHMRARVGRQIKQRLLVPSFVEGAFGAENIGGEVARRLASVTRIEVPASRAALRVTFDLAAESPHVRCADVWVNGRAATQVELPGDGSRVACDLIVPATARASPSEIKLVAREGPTDAVESQFKLRMSRLVIHDPRFRGYQFLFEHALKDWGLRLHGIPTNDTIHKRILDGYDAVWANSEYTRTWIRRYWQRDSEVLPPLVDVDNYAPLPKKNIVLNVGRFFAGSHNKKHRVLVDAFRELVDEGLMGWEFHLAGGAMKEALHQDYLRDVMQRTRGYPIFVHADLPYDELRRLYGEAALYWHASGYGEDEQRDPIKFEHFGITTVEAMASGCVPVVINRGGQPEIVREGEDGFRWDTIEQLKSRTRQLMDDPALRSAMGARAIARSKAYGREAFEAQLNRLVS